MQGRYWSSKIDDISLKPPAVILLNELLLAGNILYCALYF
jgi:hypothetical protein